MKRSNNITRRPNSQGWEVRWRIGQQRKSKTFNDKKYGGRENAYKEAEAFIKGTLADIVRGEYNDPHLAKITLSDFKEDFGIVKLSQEETTKQIYEDVWNLYIASYDIAYRPIGSIKASDVAKHIRNLKKENGDDYSNSTIKKVVEIFRILFDKALEEQFIKGINPAKTSTVRDWIPKVQHEKKIYLSHFEVNRIYQDFLEYSPQFAVAIPLLGYTGMRSGEFRGLRWEDIDLQNGVINLRKQYSDKLGRMKDLKTKNSVRSIRVPKYVLNQLREHKENYEVANCPYVFPDSNCNRPILGKNFKNRHLKPALERLDMNMKINIHSFRHTSVRLALESGAQIQAISKRLGHASVSLTIDTYSELFDTVEEQLVERLDEYIEQMSI